MDLSTQTATMECGAVELAGVVKAVLLDLSTQTVSRHWQYIFRQRWCQWVWCSRARFCSEGSRNGSVDTDGVKAAAALDLSTMGCGATELGECGEGAAVDLSVSVGVVQSSWRVW